MFVSIVSYVWMTFNSNESSGIMVRMLVWSIFAKKLAGEATKRQKEKGGDAQHATPSVRRRCGKCHSPTGSLKRENEIHLLVLTLFVAQRLHRQ